MLLYTARIQYIVRFRPRSLIFINDAGMENELYSYFGIDGSVYILYKNNK